MRSCQTVTYQPPDKHKILSVAHFPPVHKELVDFCFFGDNQVCTNKMQAGSRPCWWTLREQQLLECWLCSDSKHRVQRSVVPWDFWSDCRGRALLGQGNPKRALFLNCESLISTLTSICCMLSRTKSFWEMLTSAGSGEEVTQFGEQCIPLFLC